MSAIREKFILALDLGTSGPKAALVNTQGEIVAHSFEKNEVILLPDGGAEQCPEQWWATIVQAIHRLLAKGIVPEDEIVAICCTGQWSGTVAVDRDGAPLMNAIIWLDSRGHRYIRRITGGLCKIEGYGILRLLRWLRLTGGIPSHSGKDPIAHILFIKYERPDIYRRTCQFLEPKDYLNLRLTGRFAASFDSIALHWLTDNRNLHRVDYDRRLLRMSGMERAKFPDLKNAVEVLGPIKKEVARELGIREDVQVVTGTPDIHSAAIGSGAVDDYHGHLYVGTSSWLTCHVPFKKTDIRHNMASLPAAIPGKYIIANEQEIAGGYLNFLRDNLLCPGNKLSGEESEANIFQTFDKIAEKTPAGSHKVIVTPWLYGERTPVENHSLRSGIHNLSLSTTREDLIRAAFEGVAYNSRWLLGYVEKFIRRRMDSIHMIGGGANSDIWCQIHADVFDRTIRQVKYPLWANLRGTAFLAAVSLGYLRFEDIPARVKIANTFLPNPDNRKIYDELFREFLNIYKRNKGIYERLQRVAYTS
ncbi:MAG: FGGY-family carbohydrate kinase [Smithellaceae bacterium]|nr:FGGY-family carbohydrate kinase [Smithellaceae bacterium]